MAGKLSKNDAVEIALRDAAKRSGNDDASLESAEETTFPNAALGAARPGEMSVDMMTNGWKIRVRAGDRSLEYRANARQVRLIDFDGGNHIVYPA